MKNFVITILLVGVSVLGYYLLRAEVRLNFSSMQGKTVKIGKGDLTIPINATGEIGALSRHEIKSEASGEIVEITSSPGEMVTKGQLLIRLKKDEEQRSVDRAKADLTRAEAGLDQARVRLERLKTVGIEKAGQRIAQIEAQMSVAAFQKEKIEGLPEGQASAEELLLVQSRVAELAASLKTAQADLEDAQIQIKLAEKDVELAQASYDTAKTVLGDAEERLAETEIFSPVDGMLVQLNTQLGEVIQSGVTSFTAGTVLAVIANNSKMYVRTDVDEADIGSVRDLAPDWAKPGTDRPEIDEIPIESGTPVRVTVESFRDEEFAGVIERIHPEPNSRASSVVTYQVDILLTSENAAKLLIGMQADVEFTAESVYDTLLVPHDAIRRNEFGEMGVYIPLAAKTDDGEPEREFVKCRFGLDNGIYAQVMEGDLKEGQEVYTVLPARSDDDEDDS